MVPIAVEGKALALDGEGTALVEELFPTGLREFLVELHRGFEGPRRRLLEERGAFHAGIRAGRRPAPPPETAPLRERAWRVAPPPPDLQDRKVEITGPVDRKLMINALNSGAAVFMADFEDAHAPAWPLTLDGQRNLRDAVRRELRYESEDGRSYRLVPRPAVLMVRPRGLHLVEPHARVEGVPMSASLFDFAVHLWHNAHELVRRGSGPYFYLPKLEHAREARLWNEIFDHAEGRLGLAPGTIRATVLLETLPAVFEVDEILWELREHSAGLNCGRWDYIFSFITQYRDEPEAVFPDRGELGMGAPFLSAYSTYIVQRCHRRGAHALGGMAADIPAREDPKANEVAFARVRADKEREVANGHDGTWVAHPGLVPLAREVFDAGCPGPNQLDRLREEVRITPEMLLEVPRGPVTADGLRTNVRVAYRYLEAWLRGTGCVPIDHRMEDTATVEIARAQIWQWIRHATVLSDGRRVTPELFRRLLRDEADQLLEERLARRAWTDPKHRAELLLDRIVTSPEFVPFLATVALPELEAVTTDAGATPSVRSTGPGRPIPAE